jgi:hypothetical protein
MQSIMSTVTGIPQWPFMQEPLYRWFLFFGALIAMMTAWNGILSFMK